MRKPPIILLLAVALTAGATPEAGAAPEEAKKSSLRESLNPLFGAYLGDGKLDKTETYTIGVAWFSPGLWRSLLDMFKRVGHKDNEVNPKDNE